MFPVAIIHQKAQALGLDHLVIGGHAINAYCEPRATLDVDFLIREQDGPRWFALLAAEGFKRKHEAENFIQFSPPYGVGFRLDLMLVNESTFAKLLETARLAPCLGTELLVPDILNLIALKVHAIRYGPRQRHNKDWLEIENLVRAARLDPRAEQLRDVFHRQGTAELYAEFLKRWGPEDDKDELREPSEPYGLDLPIAPAWFSGPPQGSMEDGFHLSLLAIEQIKDRPEVFADRDRRMCDVEFTL